MATRSRIRLVTPELSRSIYCHWDGYPENMFPLLNTYYSTEEKVKELLSLGAISYLAPRVKPDENEEHSFENPAKDVVVAYHRDRGEDLRFSTEREEYNYLFNKDGKWTLE